jgi:hypothetical protein
MKNNTALTNRKRTGVLNARLLDHGTRERFAAIPAGSKWTPRRFPGRVHMQLGIADGQPGGEVYCPIPRCRIRKVSGGSGALCYNLSYPKRFMGIH